MRSRSASVLVAVVVLTSGCENEGAPTSALRPYQAGIALIQAGDERLETRARMRARPDSDVEREVGEHRNVVVVGIKPVDLPVGVGSRGENLVSPSEAEMRRAAVRALASRMVYEFTNIPAIAVELPNAAVANQLRRLPWVDYVVANTADMSADLFADNCAMALSDPQVIPWNITRMRADSAWSQATGLNGALLILDDGRDISQNQAYGTWELPAWYSYFFENQTSEPDDGSHGTLTFSAAGARNNDFGIVGSAPGAEMHYGDILPGGLSLQWQNAAAQIIDAAVSVTKVISISYSSKETYEPSNFAALRDAILNAYFQRGMLVVASTGNQSSSTIQAYPARYDEVIGVGGSGFRDEYQLNNYASGNVEIAAPALEVGVVCKGATYAGAATGTSFATPLVAGAAMLLRQKFSTMSNDQLRLRLRQTAYPMANAQKSGAGRINVNAALGPVITVSISGASTIKTPGDYTWTASASGGTPPYSWRWERSIDGGPYTQVGTGNSFGMYVDNSYRTIDLRAIATAGPNTGNATKHVSVIIPQ